MSQTTHYAAKVIGLSALFIPLNILALIALQEDITWWKIVIIISALAVADVIIILSTGRSIPKDHADNPSKSTH